MTACASSRLWPGWSRDTANCLIGAMQDWKPIESAELQCCMRASLLFYFMCYHWMDFILCLFFYVWTYAVYIVNRNTHTHTHLFNSPLSGTTRVGRYQKGKTNLDFTEASDSEWKWHQLGRMQVCTLLQTDNHTSTPPLSFLQAGCPSCRPTNSVKALKSTKL